MSLSGGLAPVPDKMSTRRRERGQAIVIMTFALSAMLAATAMVVDGGNAMNEQRNTQNAADAAALAGAVVIVEKLGGATRMDADVLAAMDEAVEGNGTALQTSYYIDFDQNVVGTVGRGGPIPTDAWGVRAHGARTFDTVLAEIAGISSWTAGAQATALGGALRGICSALDGCGVMPMTFSIPITTCDGTNRPLRIGVDWPIVSLETALDDSDGDYMSIVPMCKNGPGGVGWLDLECGGTLNDQIITPCNGPFDIPVWLHGRTGNVNNVESALNTHRGEMLLVPMFDATCRDVPSSGLPADCADSGNGENLYYHIPRFAYFLLDEAYVQGDDVECNEEPGEPLVGGNGGTSCVKGWFIRYVMHGRVGAFQPCDGTDPECLEEPLLGVQLVR